ncbi:MAG: hypothetical protein FWD72_05755, partial [Eggerthellaceae bacterium]|nr:hypothetical protein [Eggerthellaceae bacterium]
MGILICVAIIIVLVCAGCYLVMSETASPRLRHAIRKAFKMQAVSHASVSEEEIKHIVTDNTELLDDEKRMIKEIIALGDMV